MAITLYTDELTSVGETKFIPRKMGHHHRHHRHHRRRTASEPVSTQKSFCDIFSKIWNSLWCFGTRIEETEKIYPEKILSPTENHIPSNDEKNKLSQEVDSDDDLLLHRENSYHSGLITKAYLPMRVVLMLLGRWPFLLILQTVITRNAHSKIFKRIRVQNYDPNLKSLPWIYFGLTTLFILFVLIMSTLGFFSFFVGWQLLPAERWANVQKNTFKKNLVMFLLIWGCLIHSTFSNFSMFLGRKRVTRTLNFWNMAAEELQIGDVSKHRKFLIFANISYVGFLVLIYFAYSWWNIRFVRDGATLFGTLAILPLLNEDQLAHAEEWKLRVFGILVIIYCVYASRAFLFMFCFNCRLLRSLFQVWNQRLVKFLKEGEEGEIGGEQEKMESRLLLRDMTILLKMVKQMDATFGTILQSYYAIQLVNMCFELFMLATTARFNKGSDDDTTGLDIISALIALIQNVVFFFTVSLDGAAVGEEAAEGYEAIRRHPISPNASQHKKYLVYNLGFIYNERIVLTAGKFFDIDRPFIITMLGSVVTYFVIILQLQHSFLDDDDLPVQ